MSSISIVLFDNSAARIKEEVYSPRSADSDSEERVAPFTTSPLENCHCISTSPVRNYRPKVRDGYKNQKGQKGPKEGKPKGH